MVTAPLAVWSALNMTNQHAVPHGVSLEVPYSRSVHSATRQYNVSSMIVLGALGQVSGYDGGVQAVSDVSMSSIQHDIGS